MKVKGENSDVYFMTKEFLQESAIHERATNILALNVPRKTNMHKVRLGEESQILIMDALRGVHGLDFQLSDCSKYEDMKNNNIDGYWNENGGLMICGIDSFEDGIDNDVNSKQTNRRCRLAKLIKYGFGELHCNEAYDKFNDTEKALLYLFERYMRVIRDPQNIMKTKEVIDESRSIEKETLKAMNEYGFQNTIPDQLWTFKFKARHLMRFSPSYECKLQEEATAKAEEKQIKLKHACRNFKNIGACSYGNKCRFTHVPSDDTVEESNSYDNNDDNEHWFYLEARFPEDSKYPYEPLYIYIWTECPDFPSDLQLRLSRSLYEKSKEYSRDGIPCMHMLMDMLIQPELRLCSTLFEHPAFLDPEQSLNTVESVKVNKVEKSIETHYQMGGTVLGQFRYDAERIAKDNRVLLNQFISKRKKFAYPRMMEQRRNLPAYKKRDEILDLMARSKVIVVSGETGCGKTTQIPQYILDQWFENAVLSKDLPNIEIVCTQPRRISAIGVAERVASERLDSIGNVVGYQIHLEKQVTPRTRLLFCTSGILLQRLNTDPLLKNVTHIIIDEVHERTEESDFLLLILKDILKQRDDLRVILMSATLNAELFSNYFQNCPTIDIPGRTHPVKELYLEDILERCNYSLSPDSQFCRKLSEPDDLFVRYRLKYYNAVGREQPSPAMDDSELDFKSLRARYKRNTKETCQTLFMWEPKIINTELIHSVIMYIIEGKHRWSSKGAILVFLPGLQEIEKVHEALTTHPFFAKNEQKYAILPLHSTLTVEEQTAVFDRLEEGQRKIVLSTNIAETSITIDDCVFVIDCGLMKEKRFNSNSNMASLNLVFESRANAKQRSGRAGRVMPGVCFRLFTRNRHHYQFSAQPVPELHRIPLEQLVLRVKRLQHFQKRHVSNVIMESIEPPDESAIIGAMLRLRSVSALDHNFDLTALGQHLSVLPVDVRVGKLLLYGAIFGCVDDVLTIASCLAHKTPFLTPFNKRGEANRCRAIFAKCNSDHLTNMSAYKSWLSSGSNVAERNDFAEEYFLSVKTLLAIQKRKHYFLELLTSIGFIPINVPRYNEEKGDCVERLTGPVLNANGGNSRLLVSLLCASLYPNVVRIFQPQLHFLQKLHDSPSREMTAKDLRFTTIRDGLVRIHPSSINANHANYESSYLVYQDKFRTHGLFIRDCSVVSIISLLLFSDTDFKIEKHMDNYMCSLEKNWILAKAHNFETAEMLRCLRIELKKLLSQKIGDPCLNIAADPVKKRLIDTAVNILTNY